MTFCQATTNNGLRYKNLVGKGQRLYCAKHAVNQKKNNAISLNRSPCNSTRAAPNKKQRGG